MIAAPLFKRLSLGAVLGYLTGGVAIGSFGLRMFTHPESILQVAELGRAALGNGFGAGPARAVMGTSPRARRSIPGDSGCEEA